MYGLVMIVKDGAEDLPRTLAAARRYISSYSIVDTGSTDDTKAIILRELAGIRGRLYSLPWVNFGHNRSQALGLAHANAIEDGLDAPDWLLLLDADMAVLIDDDFQPDPAIDAYMIEMGSSSGFSYRLPLLVAARKQWRSVGAVHEYTELAKGGVSFTRQPTDKVRIDMTLRDRSSPAKSRWQADMLEAALANGDDPARTTFYLAQTYRELGETKKSRDFYIARSKMGGFAEEAYYAAYRAALLAPTWEQKVVECLAAWEMRPARLEALYVALRELNAHDLHRAAWVLSDVDLTPSADTLFVHRDVWQWGIVFERSIAAWWAGDRAEFGRLSDLLLADESLPQRIRDQVERNKAL